MRLAPGTSPSFAPDILRRQPKPGIEQADIAAGAAIADLTGFEHVTVGAAFGGMERRRQACEAAADDRKLGGRITIHRRGEGFFRSCIVPERNPLHGGVPPRASLFVRVGPVTNLDVDPERL